MGGSWIPDVVICNTRLSSKKEKEQILMSHKR
jgi:hypothetical protein